MLLIKAAFLALLFFSHSEHAMTNLISYLVKRITSIVPARYIYNIFIIADLIAILIVALSSTELASKLAMILCLFNCLFIIAIEMMYDLAEKDDEIKKLIDKSNDT